MAGCLPTTNMHHIQYQIQVEGVNQDVRDWLIAILVEAGMEAFEEQENLLIAAVPQAQADEEAIEEILLENNLDFTKHRIAPQNWNAQW
ncbi:MAG TPA: hypothetical protein PKD90_18010, partial [Phnomibacter sp.]|nr:hypothetical protein [Phnomibacter sp.]